MIRSGRLNQTLHLNVPVASLLTFLKPPLLALLVRVGYEVIYRRHSSAAFSAPSRMLQMRTLTVMRRIAYALGRNSAPDYSAAKPRS